MTSNQSLKKNLIIFPSNEGKWEICDFLYQTCRILAKKNLVIVINIQKAKSLKEIVIERIRNTSEFKILSSENSIYYFTPVLFIPFRRFPSVIRANIILNTIFLGLFVKFFYKEYKNNVLWFFFPQLAYLNRYFSKNWKRLYDIIDYNTSPDPTDNIELLTQKKYLLQVATLTTAISETLKEKYLSIYQQKIYVVPQGFNLDLFKNVNSAQDKSIDLHLRPSIGFIGHLNERLDFKLLEKLIQNNPQWDFIFIGPKETNINVSLSKNHKRIEKILAFKNVTWLDQQPKKKIPELVKNLTISMIPYDIQYEFNKYCYPMKVFEYFYMKKPVLSTPIEELKKLEPYVLIGATPQDWELHIKHLLKNGWSKSYQEHERELSIQNSWEAKVQKILELLETV